MCNRITILLMILTILVMGSSCSVQSVAGWRYLNDEYPDLYEKVQVKSDGEKDYHIEYESQCYNVDKLGLFQVEKDRENDVLLSWACLPFGIGYLDMYYSYTTDNPVFIYMSRFPEVYLRDDYNYETDIFIIEGTNYRFVFSDMFTISKAFQYDFMHHYSGEQYITLYSEACPRLQIPLRVFCVNDVWYAGANANHTLFEVSDEFLALLSIDGCPSVD